MCYHEGNQNNETLRLDLKVAFMEGFVYPSRIAKCLGKCSLVALMLAFNCHRTIAYGSEGHEVVGAIADTRLQTSPVREKVLNLLQPGETLSQVATWADRIRNGPVGAPGSAEYVESKFFLDHNPVNSAHDHTSYHFSDVPFQIHHYFYQSEHDKVVGSTPTDIEHMIQTCILVLKQTALPAGSPATYDNPDTNPTGLTPHVALMLLAHYLGDIHQPLHVGAGYISTVNHIDQFVIPATLDGDPAILPDRGGNYLRTNVTESYVDSKTGKTRMRPVNLHHFWDTQTVMYQLNGMTPEAYGKSLAEQMQPQPSWDKAGDPLTWSQQWADDILPMTDNAHQDLTLSHKTLAHDKQGSHYEWSVMLSPQYQAAAVATVKLELQKGGYRLVKLLETILQPAQ